MKSITPSTYNFEDLILNNAVYVDKSDYLHKLVSDINKNTYFLSRPRRFGKSLTLSSLKCIFQGKKHLFEGLKMEKLDYDWNVYPVIHINMSEFDTSTAVNFISNLSNTLHSIAKGLNVDLLNSSIAGELFNDLITKAAENSKYKKCVLLIDEYDYPLIENIDQPHLLEIRGILENFYIQIKALNDKLRFTFMTGITRFSQVSVFSKLNHLLDISYNEDFATMLGYTQSELEEYFSYWLMQFAEKEKVTYFEYLKQVKLWYNGFKFNQNAETVYNPVSVAKFIIENGSFKNYWFASGSSKFMVKMMEKYDKSISEILTGDFDTEELNSFDVTNIDLRALLVQTGYLTITKGKNFAGKTLCQIDYPNNEVKISFNTHLLPLLTNIEKTSTDQKTLPILYAFVNNDIEQVIKELKTFLAAIPYTKDNKTDKKTIEDHYRNILFVIFSLLGARISAEFITNIGKIDTVIETDKFIYLFEYKMNKTAQDAIEQIHKNRYYESFLASSKPITLIGINFDNKIKNINEYSIEELKKK